MCGADAGGSCHLHAGDYGSGDSEEFCVMVAEGRERLKEGVVRPEGVRLIMLVFLVLPGVEAPLQTVMRGGMRARATL